MTTGSPPDSTAKVRESIGGEKFPAPPVFVGGGRIIIVEVFRPVSGCEVGVGEGMVTPHSPAGEIQPDSIIIPARNIAPIYQIGGHLIKDIKDSSDE